MPLTNTEFRCVELLKTLQAHETRALAKYLDSPYFKVGEAQQKLMRHLLKLRPDYPAKKLQKPLLFQQVYGKQAAYKEKTIRDLLSDLALHLDEFIAVERVRNDRVLRRRLVLDRVVAHGRKAEIRREIMRFDREIERRPNRSIDYYHDRSYADWLHANHPDDISLRNKNTKLDEASESLDHYIVLRKAQLLLALLNRKRLLKVAFDFEMQAIVLELLRSNSSTAFRVYALLMENILQPDEQRAERVTDIVEKSWQLFDPQELTDIVALTANTIMRDENRKSFDSAWRVDRFFIEKVIPQLPLGTVSLSKAVNVYSRGLKTGKLEEGFELALQVIPYVFKAHQKDTFAYLHAHINFTKMDFERAYDYISDLNFSIPILSIHGRDLKIRILYELYEQYPDNYMVLLESTLESVLKYYSRFDTSHQVGVVKIKANINAYSTLYSISRNRKGSATRKKELIALVKKRKSNNISEWLLSKLKGL